MHVPTIDPLILWIDRPFLWRTVFQDVHVVLCRLAHFSANWWDALKSMQSTEKRGYINWWIWVCRWSQVWYDSCEAEWKIEQVWSRLDLGDRVLDCKAAPHTSDHGNRAVEAPCCFEVFPTNPYASAAVWWEKMTRGQGKEGQGSAEQCGIGWCWGLWREREQCEEEGDEVRKWEARCHCSQDVLV